MSARRRSHRRGAVCWLAVAGIWCACTAASPEQSASSGAAVTSAQDSLRQRVDSLSAEIRRSVGRTDNPDVQLTLYAVEAFQAYAYHFPDDTLSAEYLFKAGQLYAGVLGDAQVALRQYDRVVQGYSASAYRPIALFMRGNLHHDLGDTASALSDLRTLTATYPGHALAADAEALMQLIKSDEVPIEEWLRRANTPDAR